MGYEEERPGKILRLRKGMSQSEIAQRWRWFHYSRRLLLKTASKRILDMNHMAPSEKSLLWARRQLYSMAHARYDELDHLIPLIGCLYAQLLCAEQWPNMVVVVSTSDGRKYLRLDWSRWQETRRDEDSPMLQKGRNDRS